MWIKIAVLVLLLLAVVSLFRGLMAMVRGESADGRVMRALAWRIGLSVAVFALLLLSMYLGWVEPHDIRPTERYGIPIEPS